MSVFLPFSVVRRPLKNSSFRDTVPNIVSAGFVYTKKGLSDRRTLDTEIGGSGCEEVSEPSPNGNLNTFQLAFRESY